MILGGAEVDRAIQGNVGHKSQGGVMRPVGDGFVNGVIHGVTNLSRDGSVSNLEGAEGIGGEGGRQGGQYGGSSQVLPGGKCHGVYCGDGEWHSAQDASGVSAEDLLACSARG